LIAGSYFHNITKPVTPNVNIGLKEVLEKHDMSSKILRIKSCEALSIVRATASDFLQIIATVEGMVSRSPCRKTMPMDESLLKVVKKYGEKLLLKESDKKPKATKKKGKRRSSAGVIYREKRIENFDDWQGPAPWDLSLGGDGCPKFLCDVMVSTLSYLCM
jgi:hypothetical protein